MGKFRKLGRHAAHRVSMLRTMVSQLVKHERIETTVAKAKEVRTKADQMVQLGKEQDVPQPLFGVTMLFTSYSQNSPTATKIELVDIQDYCGLGYGLAMLHQWHTLSLSTGRMNFERQNLQHHSHLSGSLLIHGPSHSPANNGQVLKSARTPEQKAYDKPERSLALFYVVERFF
uniref:Ribosomal protein L17 n=1 Tax=Oryza rufipogon TaxID=4529 RepID=A0A0E0PNJ9_ORYRU